jgi:HPr kinase/phosphorylase
MNPITIRDLVEYESGKLGLNLHAGEAGMNEEVKDPSVSICAFLEKSFRDGLKPETVLIITPESGLTDISIHEREKILRYIQTSRISAIIVSKAEGVPDFFVDFSRKESIPLFSSVHDPSFLRSGLIGLFRKVVEKKIDIHGVLIEIFGIGVVIIGESGIGKSECGLELVTKGHRLISDDLVEIQKTGDNSLGGRSKDLTKYFMEIRGLGIVNIKSLFGIAAVGDECDVNIVVEFIKWENGMETRRIDADESVYEMMGVNLPLIKVPVRSGGSMATVVEIVARNYILKRKNYSASADMERRIIDRIKKEGTH